MYTCSQCMWSVSVSVSVSVCVCVCVLFHNIFSYYHQVLAVLLADGWVSLTQLQMMSDHGSQQEGGDYTYHADCPSHSTQAPEIVLHIICNQIAMEQILIPYMYLLVSS